MDSNVHRAKQQSGDGIWSTVLMSQHMNMTSSSVLDDDNDNPVNRSVGQIDEELRKGSSSADLYCSDGSMANNGASAIPSFEAFAAGLGVDADVCSGLNSHSGSTPGSKKTSPCSKHLTPPNSTANFKSLVPNSSMPNLADLDMAGAPASAMVGHALLGRSQSLFGGTVNSPGSVSVGSESSGCFSGPSSGNAKDFISKEAPARMHTPTRSANNSSVTSNGNGGGSRSGYRKRSDSMPGESSGASYCRLEGGSGGAHHRRSDIYSTDLPNLVKAADLGLKCGLKPLLAEGAMGGTYFLNSVGNPSFAGTEGGSSAVVCVFKPWDQEPHAPNNPHELAGTTSPRCPMTPMLTHKVGNIVPGFGMYREIAAYILDSTSVALGNSVQSSSFAGIPPTALARVQHPVFNERPSRVPSPLHVVTSAPSTGTSTDYESGSQAVSVLSHETDVGSAPSTAPPSMGTDGRYECNFVSKPVETDGSYSVPGSGDTSASASASRPSPPVTTPTPAPAPALQIGSPTPVYYNRPKLGSIQAFVRSECTAEDMGPSMLNAEDIIRVAVLDIRICNLDRHEGNLLVCKHNHTYFQQLHYSSANSVVGSPPSISRQVTTGSVGSGVTSTDIDIEPDVDIEATGECSSVVGGSALGAGGGSTSLDSASRLLSPKPTPLYTGSGIRRIPSMDSSIERDARLHGGGGGGSVHTSHSDLNGLSRSFPTIISLSGDLAGRFPGSTSPTHRSPGPSPRISRGSSSNLSRDQEMGSKYRLVPIDHGYCLPHILNLDNSDTHFAWLHWPVVKQPITEEAYPFVWHYIRQLDFNRDMVQLHSSIGSAIPWSSLLTLYVCTMLLKVGVLEYGVSLQELGECFIAPPPETSGYSWSSVVKGGDETASNNSMGGASGATPPPVAPPDPLSPLQLMINNTIQRMVYNSIYHLVLLQQQLGAASRSRGSSICSSMGNPGSRSNSITEPPSPKRPSPKGSIGSMDGDAGGSSAATGPSPLDKFVQMRSSAANGTMITKFINSHLMGMKRLRLRVSPKALLNLYSSAHSLNIGHLQTVGRTSAGKKRITPVHMASGEDNAAGAGHGSDLPPLPPVMPLNLSAFPLGEMATNAPSAPPTGVKAAADTSATAPTPAVGGLDGVSMYRDSIASGSDAAGSGSRSESFADDTTSPSIPQLPPLPLVAVNEDALEYVLSIAGYTPSTAQSGSTHKLFLDELLVSIHELLHSLVEKKRVCEEERARGGGGFRVRM